MLFSLLLILTKVGFLGFHAFSVQSGSMEPHIKTGSLIFTAQTPYYKEGEVITFKSSDGKSTVTHRVVSIEFDKGTYLYTVKGDANETADLDSVTTDRIIGRELFALPFLGYVVGFGRTGIGLLLLILVPAIIIIYQEILNIAKEIKLIKNKKSVQRWRLEVDSVHKIT